MSLLCGRMKRGNTRKERRSGKRRRSRGEKSRNLSFRGSNVLKPPFRPLPPRSNTLLRRGWHAIRKLDNPRESASNSADRRNGNGNRLSLPIAKTEGSRSRRLAGRGAAWCLITPEIPSNVPEALGAYETKSRGLPSPSAALAIPTSETIYSRAIAKLKELHLISRETVCFSARIQRVNFDFRARETRRSEICNVETCEGKICSNVNILWQFY